MRLPDGEGWGGEMVAHLKDIMRLFLQKKIGTGGIKTHSGHFWLQKWWTKLHVMSSEAAGLDMGWSL